MIDAYEIGIQLLLQEDVSAGLVVINRGLSEVDQAITATSAKLVALAGQASKTTSAVTNVTSKPTPPSHSEGSAAIEEHDLPPGQPTAKPTYRAPSANPSNATPTNPTDLNHRAGPAAKPVSAESSPRNDAHKTVTPLTAPPPSVQVSTGLPQQSASAPNTALIVSAAEQKVDVSSVAKPLTPPSTAPSPASPRIANASLNQRVKEPLVASTSFLSQQRAELVSSSRQEKHRSSHVHEQVKQLPEGVAPWAGVEHRPAEENGRGSYERAAAPVALGQNRVDPSGGSVILDGRLVGQWLSDHMAREASRPPAGTTFFDARQAPAWTVAGAI